jgi:hypothetical protein
MATVFPAEEVITLASATARRGDALDDDQGQNAQLLAQAGGVEVAREASLTRPMMTTAYDRRLINLFKRLCKSARAARWQLLAGFGNIRVARWRLRGSAGGAERRPMAASRPPPGSGEATKWRHVPGRRSVSRAITPRTGARPATVGGTARTRADGL